MLLFARHCPVKRKLEKKTLQEYRGAGGEKDFAGLPPFGHRRKFSCDKESPSGMEIRNRGRGRGQGLPRFAKSRRSIPLENSSLCPPQSFK